MDVVAGQVWRLALCNQEKFSWKLFRPFSESQCQTISLFSPTLRLRRK